MSCDSDYWRHPVHVTAGPNIEIVRVGLQEFKGIPDPLEIATAPGWLRVQQICFHARMTGQWGMAGEATIAMAQHLAAQNHVEAARDLLLEMQTNKRFGQAERARASMHLAILKGAPAQGDRLAALIDALPALEAEGSSPYAYALMRVAIACVELDDLDAARLWFSRATNSATDRLLRAQVQDELAMLERRAGNYAVAEKLHTTALSIFRELGADTSIVINLAAQAELAASQNDLDVAYERAIEEAEVAVSAGMEGHAADASLRAGAWAAELGKLQLAESALRDALGHGLAVQDYDPAPAYYQLALVLLRQGQISQGISHVREVVRRTPPGETRDRFASWLEALLDFKEKQGIEGREQP